MSTESAPASVAAPAATPAASAAKSDFKTDFLAGLSTIRGKNPLAADLSAAQAQVQTLTTDLAAARAEIETLKAQNAAPAAIGAYFGIEAATLAGKTAPEITALISAKISALAADQVAGYGFPSADLPKPAKSEGGHDFSALIQEYAQIEDPIERGRFYATHIAPLGRPSAAPGRN